VHKRVQGGGALQRIADEVVAGRDDITAAIRAAPFQLYSAAQVFVDLGQEEMVVNAMVRMTHPQPWAALVACSKVLKQQTLTQLNGEALSELVRIRNDDRAGQRQARAWLFNWLWQILEPET
jgi:hypothetical protein